ncbi:MAG: TIGR02300 family protein [Alphaproteobacteria bacterium]|nr:TIGR02300 family protein [Alphaproteobacteria bacterium]
MSKPEWGTKRICQSCSTRFYDMHRQPITCPKCEIIFDPDTLIKKRRGRPPLSESKAQPVVEELEVVLELDLEEDLTPLSESDDLLEDTSDFGGDEAVVGIEPVSRDD